jgi:hypothetical protein
MFVLRRITSNGSEINTPLKESYNLITEERNPEEYKTTLKVWIDLESDPDIYGFIVHNNGTDIIPLYKKSTYFVMTGSGQTFANITYK